MLTLLYIALPVLIIDQLSKFIILKNFHPGESLPVIKNIFHISLVFNKGVAFGMFSEAANSALLWIFYICAVIVVFILIFCGIGKYIGYHCENRSCALQGVKVIAERFSCKKFFAKGKSTQIFLALILAGAVGNLIDRIRFGFVVDFLDFRIWPVFNIADSAVTVGTALLILQILKHKKHASNTF